ncbi:MAG: hypothetical protein ACP5U1_03545 [Desulfomonilaceae bacterium]
MMMANQHKEPVSKHQEMLRWIGQADKLPKPVKPRVPHIDRSFPKDSSDQGIKAPHGFRALSRSQALWEYSLPLMYIVPAPENVSKANQIFEVVRAIWNSTTDDPVVSQTKTNHEIVTMIQERLELDQIRAKNFLSTMRQRKESLFPSYIQPKDVPFVFMKNEPRSLIERFDYESLKLNDRPIGPDKPDLDLVGRIQMLDQYIMGSSNHDEYRKLLVQVQDECSERFSVWLIRKGAKNHDGFSFFTDVYVSYIYGCRHKKPITFQSGPADYLIEFMVDHLFRKTSIEPWEYSLCPSAIRLFYRFLNEKGYLTHPPEPMIDYIDRLEPFFLDVLRERFSLTPTH